jgi:hypothetical protein
VAHRASDAVRAADQLVAVEDFISVLDLPVQFTLPVRKIAVSKIALLFVSPDCVRFILISPIFQKSTTKKRRTRRRNRKNLRVLRFFAVDSLYFSHVVRRDMNSASCS